MTSFRGCFFLRVRQQGHLGDHGETVEHHVKNHEGVGEGVGVVVLEWRQERGSAHTEDACYHGQDGPARPDRGLVADLVEIFKVTKSSFLQGAL